MISKRKLIYRYRAYEIWVEYDREADLYSIFCSDDENDWIGEADTLVDAKKFAKEYCQEQYQT